MSYITHILNPLFGENGIQNNYFKSLCSNKLKMCGSATEGGNFYRLGGIRTNCNNCKKLFKKDLELLGINENSPFIRP